MVLLLFKKKKKKRERIKISLKVQGPGSPTEQMSISFQYSEPKEILLHDHDVLTIASSTLVSKLSLFLCSTLRLSLCGNGCEQSFASVSVITVSDNWACSGHGQLLQAIQRELWPQGSHHRRRASHAHLRRNPLPPRHSWGSLFRFNYPPPSHIVSNFITIPCSVFWLHKNTFFFPYWIKPDVTVFFFKKNYAIFGFLGYLAIKNKKFFIWDHSVWQ